MWKAVFPLLSAFFVGLSCMPGGVKKIEDADNDEGFQRALQFAVAKHNNMTNDMHIRQVTKVLSAESQVVEGLKYIMTVMLERTNCEKGGPAENCTVHSELEQAKPYKCTFSVWSRPWLNDTQLTETRCSSSAPPPPLGFKPVPVPIED